VEGIPSRDSTAKGHITIILIDTTTPSIVLTTSHTPSIDFSDERNIIKSLEISSNGGRDNGNLCYA